MDSYKKLLEHLNMSPIEFYNIGLKDILYFDDSTLLEQWNIKKDSILKRKEKQYIRTYGRKGQNSNWFKVFYKHLLGIEIEFDSTNNDYPERVLNKYSNYRKGHIGKKSKFTEIYNYQIAHLFGRTKNPFLFTALWNISYIPKYLDPFTGHETKGEIAEVIRPIFINDMKKKYKKYIDDYNNMYSIEVEANVESAITKTIDEVENINIIDFKRDVYNELSKID